MGLNHLSCGLVAVGLALACRSSVTLAQAAPPMQRIIHGLPALVEQSRALGDVPASEVIKLSLILPLRHGADLDDLLLRLYTPSDPAYGHYLTPQQFTARFGPTQTDYNTVIAWARVQGLAVTQTYANRKVVHVEAATCVVEQAFGVKLRRYQAPDGTLFRAPTSEARVPVSIAARLATVLGLDTTFKLQPHLVRHPANPFLPESFPPNGDAAGQGNSGEGGGSFTPNSPPSLTGPTGGLSPFAIKAAYDLADPTTGNDLIPFTGTGQTLGLVEFDGFHAQDVTTYENQFNISPVTLEVIPVDGFNTKVHDPNGGAYEVTLDIELMTALAPGVNKILVYEALNSTNNQIAIDLYQKIADDNRANVISTSWGMTEDKTTANAGLFNAEHSILQQMAAQGQSIFAASGDDGSQDLPGQYPPTTQLHVDDPASQPYMTGVGGTKLFTQANGSYSSERTYNEGPRSRGSGTGGGGISVLWSLPSWQQNILDPSVISNASTTMRNVPDVSLNSDPVSGYAIYYAGTWRHAAGGTSCAAPLWAAFTALVNQGRVADNSPALGFANPPIYYVAMFNHPQNKPTGPNYAYDFHDITVGNNNVDKNPAYYPAVQGFDDATGWGTFDGAHLLGDLVSLANTGTLSQLLGNNGFEQSDLAPAPWITTPNVIVHSPGHPAHSGRWMAWLCGYGVTHTDTLAQTVRIPSLATAATLSFWLHIDTQETTTTLKNDTLTVQLVDLTDATKSMTLATYSNLDQNVGYVQQSFALPTAMYAGHTLKLLLTGSENASLQTSFMVDDFLLAITE